jgi:glutamine amidotransferase
MNNADVVVIDYGMGNMLSVQRGIEHCGASVSITDNHEEIRSASRVILPGVGAFDHAMKALKDQGLIEVIHEVAQKGTPLLGICLGMQLLLDESEEFGITKGLGLIPGRVVSIPYRTVSGEPHKIPHIGWNELIPTDSKVNWDKSILRNIGSNKSVYFVHSFMVMPEKKSNRIANCVYGGHEVVAMIARDNITGCQFHPEKSGEVGLNILRNFVSD